MKKNKSEFFKLPLLTLLFSCGILAIFGSGCGISWQEPEFGGTGLRSGRAMLELDGSPVKPIQSASGEEMPPGYLDWHLWGGSYGLNLDVALALLAGISIKETLFTKEALVAASIDHEEINKRIPKIQPIGDPRADLTVLGGFGNLQYEFPRLAFLPIPIVKNIRPYVGFGIGYLFKVDYDVETKLAGDDPVFPHLNTPFAGRGRATKFVAGGHVFSDSTISIRLEYQRLESTMTLHASEGGLKKPLSLDGQIFLMEFMLNRLQ